MKSFISFALLTVLGTAFGQEKSLWQEDVYFGVTPFDRPAQTWQTDAETDCRKKIESIVCYVEGSHDSVNPWSRPCLDKSREFVPAFQYLHDQLPPKLQRMFCSLEKLYVEKDLESTAYALRWAPVIGIRASIIENRLTLSDWSTWKEQLNFGGKNDSYQTRADLPVFTGGVPEGVDGFLYSVVVHEFGHLLDFANDVNATHGFNMKPGTFGELSWQSPSTPRKEFDFPNRNRLCFYRCGGSTIPKSAVPQIYSDLYKKTNFLNAYTARNAYEDFADSFSFYVLFKETNSTYGFETRQGQTVDLRQVMSSPTMGSKVRYLSSFLDRNDLRYP